MAVKLQGNKLLISIKKYLFLHCSSSGMDLKIIDVYPKHTWPHHSKSLVFLLVCEISHLVVKACEKCLCDVVLGSVRWHQAWCSPTRCVRSVHVVVGRSAWGGVCWEQLLAGYGSGSVQQSFLCSSCLFLLSSLHKCCQRLIPCALCNVPPAQMWIRKKLRSCNRGQGRVCVASVYSVNKIYECCLRLTAKHTVYFCP